MSFFQWEFSRVPINRARGSINYFFYFIFFSNFNYIIKSLIEAQKYNPDFVVYTGDYVSYESNEQIEQLKTVMQQATLGSLGTFGVLGNHDYGKNWAEQDVADSIAEILRAALLWNKMKRFTKISEAIGKPKIKFMPR